MTIRQLVIINDFSIKRGGATGLALLCAQRIRDAGVPVTFISGDDGAEATLKSAGIEHIALGNVPFAQRRTISGVARGIWNTAAERSISDWIARHDDGDTVYHLHGWHSILSPSVFSALKRVRGRTVVHAHDFFLVCPNGAFMHFPENRVCNLRPLSAACITSNCDRRHYSHKLLRVVRQEVQNRVARAQPASRLARGSEQARDDVDVMLIHPAMKSFFQRAGWPSERLVVVPNPCVPFSRDQVPASKNRAFFFVGRLDQEKGARDFAEAAQIAGVPAVIVGEGPERAALEAQFPEIEFTGWRAGPEIGALVQTARCLVMPSRYPEPFGLVAVEALSSGIPVIAAAHCLIAHDIESKGMGISVDTRDHAAFAAALRTIAGDDAMVDEMSRRAVAQVGELCNNLDQWGKALIEQYERLIARDATEALAVSTS